MIFQVVVTDLLGSFSCRPGYQLAEVRRDNPEGAQGVGTAVTSAGPEQFSLTPSASGDLLMRLGVMFSTPTSGAANVELIPTLHDCGETLGVHMFDVQPGSLNATTPLIVPVTGWGATVGLDADAAVKAGIVVMDNLNASSIKNRLAYRVAIDKATPRPWVLLETGYHTPAAGNSERNTGALDLSGTGDDDPANNVWFQLATALLLDTNETRATIQVTSHAMRS